MNLIHQFYERHAFDAARVGAGLRLMTWGLFKKVVIADRLALIVNPIYAEPRNFDGPALALATVAFAYQIYCDFSGYTDIARGAALVLGFRLMPNFATPFAARSVGEFWRRWHISLSTWFRDYLYIPLGGNRAGAARHQWNLAIVFLVSGLWHGANWTFLVWGALHGVYMLASTWTAPLRRRFNAAFGLARRPRVHHALQVALVFTVVTYAWIWFRASSGADAVYVTTHLLRGWGSPLAPGVSRPELLGAAAAVALLEIVQLYQRRGVVHTWLRSQPTWLRWAIYYAVATAILLFGVFDNTPFIYFQF